MKKVIKVLETAVKKINMVIISITIVFVTETMKMVFESKVKKINVETSTGFRRFR